MQEDIAQHALDNGINFNYLVQDADKLISISYFDGVDLDSKIINWWWLSQPLRFPFTITSALSFVGDIQVDQTILLTNVTDVHTVGGWVYMEIGTSDPNYLIANQGIYFEVKDYKEPSRYVMPQGL